MRELILKKINDLRNQRGMNVDLLFKDENGRKRYNGTRYEHNETFDHLSDEELVDEFVTIVMLGSRQR